MFSILNFRPSIDINESTESSAIPTFLDVSTSSETSHTTSLNFSPDMIGTSQSTHPNGLADLDVSQSADDVISMLYASTGTLYKCEICNKHFTHETGLKRHLPVHDEDYQFTCTTCSSYYKTREEFDAHNAAYHYGVHLCATCGKTFTLKSSLRDHSLKHKNSEQSTSRRLFICSFEDCGKKFIRQTLYQDHLNVHSNVKPYACSTCGMQFSGRYRLNYHKRVCSGSLKIMCNICNIEFKDPTCLKRHKDAKHEKQVNICECGKQYKYYSSLFKHKREQNH